MKEELAVKNLREVKEVFDKLGIRYWLDWGTLLGAVRDGKIIEWDHDIDLGTIDNWQKIVSAFPELKKRGFGVLFEDFKIYKNISKKVVDLYRFGCPITIVPYRVNGENALYVVNKIPHLNRSPHLISRGLDVLYYLLTSQEPRTKLKWKPIAKVLGHCLSLFPPKLKRSFCNAVVWIWRQSGPILFQIVIPKHYFEKLGAIKFYGMVFNIPSDVEDYLKYHYGEDWKIPKKEWTWYKEDGAVRVSTAQ